MIILLFSSFYFWFIIFIFRIGTVDDYTVANILYKDTVIRNLEFCILGDPTAWFMSHRAHPILSGVDRGLCGPKYKNATCSTKRTDWVNTNSVDIGPCCASDGTCGESSVHCNYPGIDFREIIDGNYEHNILSIPLEL